MARLSEVEREPGSVEHDFWSRREVLSDGHSRLGESGSPKRVQEVNWCIFVESSSRRGLCVILSEGGTRPGEKSSSKRDNVGKPLS